jgi:hypothetical protein
MEYQANRQNIMQYTPRVVYQFILHLNYAGSQPTKIMKLGQFRTGRQM